MSVPTRGRFDPGRIERLRQLVDWVDERRQIFQRTGKARAAQSSANVVLLVSGQTYAAAPHEHWLRESFESLEGASRLLQSGAYAYSVCDEAGLPEHLMTCRLLVLPHVLTIDEPAASLIWRWVEQGGKLLVVGPISRAPWLALARRAHRPKLCRAVAASTDVEPLQEFLGQGDLQRAGYGYLAFVGALGQGFEPVPLIVWGRFFPFEMGDSTPLMEYRYPLARAALESGADYGAIMGYSAPGDETAPAVALRHVGQAGGAVLVCGVDVFRSYWRQPNYRSHHLVAAWMEIMGFQPSIQVVENSRPAVGVELVTAHDPVSGALLVHLINLRDANASGLVAERLPAIHHSSSTSMRRPRSSWKPCCTPRPSCCR